MLFCKSKARNVIQKPEARGRGPVGPCLRPTLTYTNYFQFKFILYIMCKIPALQQSLEKNNKNRIVVISFT